MEKHSQTNHYTIDKMEVVNPFGSFLYSLKMGGAFFCFEVFMFIFPDHALARHLTFNQKKERVAF